MLLCVENLSGEREPPRRGTDKGLTLGGYLNSIILSSLGRKREVI